MHITWYGHSAFRLDFGACHVLIDPFFTGNPGFPSNEERAAAGITHILLTHGHADHVGDTIALAKAHDAVVVANYDVCQWLGSQGLEKLEPGNTGGTVACEGFDVTFVRADHSSGLFEQGVTASMGDANGLIVRTPNEPVLYAMGDTDLFSDMALIAERFCPEIALVPIGGRFTMDAANAALALTRYVKPRFAIPCHFGSFPVLAQDAQAFIAALEGSGIQAVAPHAGLPVRF
jgi:L-ascorbate metabolism protein UlaG (beta-lactamase superfamily)